MYSRPYVCSGKFENSVKQIFIFILAVLLWTVVGCGSSEPDKGPGVGVIEECKSPPRYLPRAGFMPGKDFGFSIAESGTTGLSLVQFARKGVPYKRFAFPSWSVAGHLGAVVTDKSGNCYVIPRPFINTLGNEPKDQNILYKVDTETGEMTPFVDLPSLKPASQENPYGLLGLVLDCETDLLYASSVMGSERLNPEGSIYAISPEGDVVSRFTHLDAMGVGLAYLNGKKYLFFGSARTSEVFQLELDKKGRFVGQPVKVLSLKNLGERGDDKARKIRFSKTGDMIVSGISFNFNLANSPDRLENVYTFRYMGENGWKLIGMVKGQM